MTDGQAAPLGRPNLAAKLRSTRTDFLGFRHSLLGTLCGAAGLLAAAALLFEPPHPTLVSVTGTVLLGLCGADTVHASLTRPRGIDEPPAHTPTPTSLNQTLPINRRQMAVYLLVSLAFAVVEAALAADTVGVTRLANLAGTVVFLAAAFFFAGYALLGDRASVRITDHGVADSTRPWKRRFVPWSALAAISLQPMPGTSPRVLLHVRGPGGGTPELVPVQAQFVRGRAQAVVDAITRHPCYRGRTEPPS